MTYRKDDEVGLGEMSVRKSIQKMSNQIAKVNSVDPQGTRAIQAVPAEPQRKKAPDYDFWHEKAREILKFTGNGDKVTIDSRDLSKLTSIPHWDVLKRGRRIIDRDYGDGASGPDGSFAGGYLDGNGQERPRLDLPLHNALEIIENVSRGLKDAVRDMAFERKQTVESPSNSVMTIDFNCMDSLQNAVIVQNQYLLEKETINQEQRAVIEEMVPKADSYDDVIDAPEVQLLTDGGRGLGLKPNKFVGRLREYKFLSNKNVAMQRYVDQGIFKNKEKAYHSRGGVLGLKVQTYITSKGVAYFQKLIKDRKFYVEDIRV